MKLLKALLLVLAVTLAFDKYVSCEDDTPVLDIDDDGDDDDDEVDTTVKEEEDVLILTNDNFDTTVYSKGIILVEFYAPWCGHCKSLAPEYSKAAKALKENDPPIPLAKVDATENKELGQRFDVSGYPTIKFFKNGEPYDYEGPRDSEGIIAYMKEKASPDWKPPPPAVIELKTDNFDEFINNQELALVEFYAPWCGHCKTLAPKYEKAAQVLKQRTPPIPLVKIDATVESSLATRYGVTGYPTLKIFRNGRESEYKGPRDEGIVNYMIKQTEEASKLLMSVKDVQSYLRKDAMTIIGFFESINDKQLQIMKDVANLGREIFKFGHTLNKDVWKHYKIQKPSVVVFVGERFHTKYEPKRYVIDKEDFTEEELKTFVEKNAFPLVGEYNYEMEPRYREQRPLCLVFYTVDWSFDHRDATNLWRTKMAKIAKDFKNISFAIANEEDYKNVIQEFGLEDSPEEINIGCFGLDGKKYPMEPMEEFDSEEIVEFLTKLKKGKLKPHLKSQGIPKRNAGPVKIVVGKSFEKVVLDKNKDVLIELYAPWCGHCKTLEPIYNELAKKLKKEKNLVIAKLDATANEILDPYTSSGFPTIYFAPSNKKSEPIKFEGDRTLEELEKFVKEHSTVAFKTKDEL